MESRTADDPIHVIERKIEALQEELVGLRAAREPEPVSNAMFDSPTGPVSLTTLFGDRDDMLVVHNMGRRCSYCTLWADGFNGLHAHLESRAAFVVVTPDPVVTQIEFGLSRGWKFRMVSDATKKFTDELGFLEADGSCWPGISALYRESDGQIYRKNRAVLGPFDPFCAAWHMFSLLRDGVNDWEPHFAYDLP